ncbi:DUF6891 domain-containing protein [Salana multivorans]
MDPNARPEITLPDGRSAINVFGTHTVDGIWPHVLVPRPGGAEPIASALHELAAAGIIERPSVGAWSYEELAQSLWNARLAQQATWPSEGWPLERIAARLRAERIAAEWALPVDNHGDAAEALQVHQKPGVRGAVFLTEAQAVELALEPGDAHVGPEGFVEARRRGIFGRKTITVDDYRVACESVAASLVAAAQAEGVSARWDGDWERAVVLEDVQYVARVR